MALFRPSRLLPRPLQWRQFWTMLELDTDRASVELRIASRSRLLSVYCRTEISTLSFRDIATAMDPESRDCGARYRARCCASPRNDGGLQHPALALPLQIDHHGAN